jgi:hypothetical protein
MVHSARPAFGLRLNPIGRGGLLVRWSEAGRRPVDTAHGYATVARLSRDSRRGRHARSVVTVAGVDAMARAARACWRLPCSVVSGVSMRTVRGGHRARRMAAWLTKGGWVPTRWQTGRRNGVSSRAATQSRRRGSPAFSQRRAR